MLPSTPTSFADTCSVEIRVHRFIFFCVVCSVTRLVFPTIILYFIFFATTNLAVSSGLLTEKATAFAAGSWFYFFVFSLALLLIVLVLLAWRKIKSGSLFNHPDRKIKPVPDNNKGRALHAETAKIWDRFLTLNRPYPGIEAGL